MVIKEIKQDKKKQHFDDIYVEPTPVPYKIRILDALDYISDNFNKQMFDAHILSWAQKQNNVRFMDLGACFGNTTLATVFGMSYDDIRQNWKDESSCKVIQSKRRINCHTIAADISALAMAYGKDVGIFDTAITSDLNARGSDAYRQVVNEITNADIVLSTAALIYLDLESVEELVGAFASTTKKEGYVLVNFLNPFGTQKADKTKQILLKHLEFVGSRATRHRRMSELEQRNYPGEEWALLELWVLKRRA